MAPHSERRDGPMVVGSRRILGSPAPPKPVPLTHPAFAVAALIAVAALLVSVSFRIFDYDLWEHLVVGKYIWGTGRIPTTQLWTWPTLGEPAIIPSWGFRALLWPFWHWGGVSGLFAWRWIVALATFAILFATARRMGAEPFTTLVVLVLAGLTYRARSMVRPEGLALLLFAAQVAILVARRHGGPRRGPWLVVILWTWVNVHLTFVMGFALMGVYGLAEWWDVRHRAGTPVGDGRLGWGLGRLTALALAASLLNPYGWKVLVQPVSLLLHGRHEPIYQGITELGPLDWKLSWTSGLPLFLVGWPLLLAWRARRRGLDGAELWTCLGFTALTLLAQRFKSAYVVAAAPYVARELSDWLATRRITPLALPAGVRGALASVAMVALGWREWSLPQFPIGATLDMHFFPVAACDFIAREGIRGRAFNHFWYGGYMEYRFWPERDRLPFMDGHLESGRERDRTLYTYAQVNRDAWRTLERERRFDFALLSLKTPVGAPLREFLEADSSWAMVFADDAAAVFVRRGGSLDAVAERHAYRVLRVGSGSLQNLLERCTRDSTLRAGLARECRRQVAESPDHAVASSILAELALMEGRPDEARRWLRQAIEADPRSQAARRRLQSLEAPP